MEDNFLNNQTNLNPDLKAIAPILTSKQKEEKITQWNNNPITKQNNIKAIDSSKRTDINKHNYYLLYVLGIIGFLVIAIAFGVFGYIVYQDGTLQDILNFTCSPIINIPGNPPCPEMKCSDIPDCICSDCSPILNCGEQT